jgi:energy-coupling factor transporter ATP-binding protein EcfA2
LKRAFISGPNFSGRSAALREALQRDAPDGSTFYIGPYAEAALSGLTSTLRDEILLYRDGTVQRSIFDLPFGAEAHNRDPQSLSGGEQILLALHCFSQSRYSRIAVDTALEQLDPANRAAALAYLASAPETAMLIDNHPPPAGWDVIQQPPASPMFAIDWQRLAELTEPQTASRLAIDNLTFSYRGGKTIFTDACVALEPGHAYRVAGANGAGKTTFFKLLVGALVPSSAEMTLGGTPYRPWRDGNRALALATQNPDQQWCGATLDEDMARRRKALAAVPAVNRIAPERVSVLAGALGISSLDMHLYELPLAARKRLSWTWPFAGVHPWIMLDEPTVGQDSATREALADHITVLCARGYGVMFVTHDSEFADRLPHRVLTVADRMLRLA